jgi:tetratricopeptide (TPR) repeat protein
MRKMILIFLPIIILLTSRCKNKNTPLVKRSDYAAYLQAPKTGMAKINTQLNFWQQRLEKNPDDMAAQLKIASLLSKRFAVSGNIMDVRKSDSLYQCANMLQKHFGSSVYRSLATNAITQHRFKMAAALLDTAFQMGDDKKLTVLQMSDAALECGLMTQCKRYLNMYPDKKSFEYLSRKAKITDKEGDLGEAINLMKKALVQMEQQHDTDLLCWVKTNLADYYSHHNEVKKALGLYREALSTNPEYYHALKGIAWIAFSHDRNTVAATEILEYLAAVHPVPDYDLLLAEIADYTNDAPSKEKYIRSFIGKTSVPEYGDMYNKYLFSLYADELGDAKKALGMAEAEINNRPTAEAYSWLSWATYKSGDIEKAYQIQRLWVEGKCFEPDAVWRMAVICGKKGETKKAQQYMNEVKTSLFELGPSFERKLNGI